MHKAMTFAEFLFYPSFLSARWLREGENAFNIG